MFSLPASLMLRRLAALPAARLTTCLTTCLTTWLTSRLTAFLAVCLSACFALPAFAAYPEKPLRMVLPYAAGGSGDIIFRRDAWRDSDGDRRANEIGFFAIPNVRDVELLLQKLGQTAKH